MTEQRYEIEFQGSNDGGRTWIAYPFRYKPQDPMERPGIYAPYQPRFEWNLWFASLAPWQASPWVVAAQARLRDREPRRARALPARSVQADIHPRWCARCAGSTGSRARKRSARPARGGRASFLASSPASCRAMRRAA